jgi:hypothetical protein
VSIADLQLDNLVDARQYGTVQNLRDRRFDLYSVHWVDKPALPAQGVVARSPALETPTEPAAAPVAE